MKAAVLTHLKEPLQILSGIEMPELKRGQILVKFAFSGVCHSQVMEARGHRGVDPWLPHMLGHEGSGRVEQIGEGVSKVTIGDKVILGWIKGEGIEAGGVKYGYRNQTINAGAVTTFNEYAIVSENRVVKSPTGLPLDIAVLFGCALLTGAGLVMNEVKPSHNASVAVFGLGGIGLSALMATQLYEPSLVIAIDISEEKLALARELGATHTINPSNEDHLRTLTNLSPRGFDYCIEASGQAKVIEQAFQAVNRNGGLCVFASHPKDGSRISIDPYEMICGKQLRGSWGGASNPDRDIPRLAKLYLEGKLPLERLITKRYSLDQINQAINDLENRNTGRPLIEIDPSLT
jgi:S-(hydroxymethyl)glutathione dehydrogenase/alcohol dehydrogenase